MDESLLAKDFAARDDALDVTRSFIIQAPAGSGKTELLIQRYLNLLAVVQHPEEIIAITFTRKAAAEMQLRVLDALRRAASGNAPQQDHERRTFELASSALARSAKLSWDLVGNPRRMRIMTLDSLNRSILRSQALRPNGTGASVVDGAAAVATYRDAALATLDWLAESGECRTRHTARLCRSKFRGDRRGRCYCLPGRSGRTTAARDYASGNLEGHCRIIADKGAEQQFSQACE